MSQQSQLRIKVIIILASIAFALLMTGTVVMIVSSNYGFSIASSLPCTAASGTYFLIKYTANNQFLSASFVGILFAATCTLVLLILIIPPFAKISKAFNKKAEESVLEEVQKSITGVVVVLSFALLGTLIPTAYAASVLIEVNNKCSLVIDYTWPTILVTTALSLVLLILSYFILLRSIIQGNHNNPETQLPKPKSDKEQTKIQTKAIQGEIISPSNQQKAPLLQRQIAPQLPAEMNQHFETITYPPSNASFQEPIVQSNPTKQHNQPTIYPPRVPQLSEGTKTHQQKKQTSSLPAQLEKHSKIEIKPDSSQSVTTINFNFPNVLPGQSPQMQVLSSSSSYDSINKRKQKRRGNSKQRGQVIKQSREEELSSDSDDYYYKRARKTKRRFEEDSNMKDSKKKRNVDVDYQRDFQRIPSRFHASPSEPRYVVLSPESFKTFYKFVKQDEQLASKKGKRHFPPPHIKKQQLNVDNVASKLAKSEVKPFPEIKHLNNDYLKRQEKKQFSIYHNLNASPVSDNQNSIKKYQPFFKSSRLLEKQEVPSAKDSELDEYFNILNSDSRVKRSRDQSANYHSISNYSSVLNEQEKGKIPTQRETSSHNKINLQQNKIRSIKNNRQKKSMIDQIRNKYN